MMGFVFGFWHVVVFGVPNMEGGANPKSHPSQAEREHNEKARALQEDSDRARHIAASHVIQLEKDRMEAHNRAAALQIEVEGIVWGDGILSSHRGE